MRTLLRVCVCCVVLSLLAGCAGSYYSQGQKSLNSGDYDGAITSLNLALEQYPDDAEILRELGIAYYSKTEMDTAVDYLLNSFFQDSTDGRTLFYLGTAFEIQKKPDHAMDMYRRYTEVDQGSDIRASLEARMQGLVHKKIQLDIQRRVAEESLLTTAFLPDTHVAVLYFKNLGKNEQLNPIQKGLADMIITDLSKVNKLKVVERIRLQKLMEEINLGMTGLIDDASAPRIGKLLGAGRLVNGAFVDLAEDDIQIDAGVLDAQDKQTIQTGQAKGKLEELLKLEKNLVFELIDNMGIELTQAERDEIEIIPTENLLAFMAYCKGLDYDDRGLFDDATREYQNAIQLDPGFIQAQQNLVLTQELQVGSMSIQELEQQYAGGGSGETQETEPAVQVADQESDESETQEVDVPSLVGQMIRTSIVLDQGFLPGVESREPAQEQGTSSFGNTASLEVIVHLPASPTSR